MPKVGNKLKQHNLPQSDEEAKIQNQFSHLWRELRPKTLIGDGNKIDFFI